MRSIIWDGGFLEREEELGVQQPCYEGSHNHLLLDIVHLLHLSIELRHIVQ